LCIRQCYRHHHHCLRRERRIRCYTNDLFDRRTCDAGGRTWRFPGLGRILDNTWQRTIPGYVRPFHGRRRGLHLHRSRHRTMFGRPGRAHRCCEHASRCRHRCHRHVLSYEWASALVATARRKSNARWVMDQPGWQPHWRQHQYGLRIIRHLHVHGEWPCPVHQRFGGNLPSPWWTSPMQERMERCCFARPVAPAHCPMG
jgi:hypothetical protein